MNEAALSGSPSSAGERRMFWALPAAYSLHIVEEVCGGFPRWVIRVLHGEFGNLAFVLNNAVFMVVLIALVLLNTRRNSPAARFALVVFAGGNLFWDSIFHLLTTVWFNRYSPGLMTAALLYIPLSIFLGASILRRRELKARRFLAALVIGLLLFCLVVWHGLFRFAV